MRRVIGWNQLALICKHRMGGCGMETRKTWMRERKEAEDIVVAIWNRRHQEQ